MRYLALNKKVIVQGGRFKGQEFIIENRIENMPGGVSSEDPLNELAMKGNLAAANAIMIDNYEIEDAPFYYGHIEGLGYIISAKDLGL